MNDDKTIWFMCRHCQRFCKSKIELRIHKRREHYMQSEVPIKYEIAELSKTILEQEKRPENDNLVKREEPFNLPLPENVSNDDTILLQNENSTVSEISSAAEKSKSSERRIETKDKENLFSPVKTTTRRSRGRPPKTPIAPIAPLVAQITPSQPKNIPFLLTEPNGGIEEAKCPECHAEFETFLQMNKHVLGRHPESMWADSRIIPDGKPSVIFNCPFCPHSTWSYERNDEHLKTHNTMGAKDFPELTAYHLKYLAEKRKNRVKNAQAVLDSSDVIQVEKTGKNLMNCPYCEKQVRGTVGVKNHLPYCAAKKVADAKAEADNHQEQTVVEKVMRQTKEFVICKICEQKVFLQGMGSHMARHRREDAKACNQTDSSKEHNSKASKKRPSNAKAKSVQKRGNRSDISEADESVLLSASDTLEAESGKECASDFSAPPSLLVTPALMSDIENENFDNGPDEVAQTQTSENVADNTSIVTRKTRFSGISRKSKGPIKIRFPFKPLVRKSLQRSKTVSPAKLGSPVKTPIKNSRQLQDKTASASKVPKMDFEEHCITPVEETIKNQSPKQRKENESATPKKVRCEVCKMKFESQKSLIVHKRHRHSFQRNTCGDCSIKFDNSAMLKQHMKNEHNDKCYECNECKIAFSSFKTLTRVHFVEAHNYTVKGVVN